MSEQTYDKNDYSTPKEIIDFARRVMGTIDCDPATNEVANDRFINAPLYYTKKEDGLDDAHDWGGNVWLNPPYQRGVVGAFADKVIDQYLREKISQALVLVNSSTASSWYQYLIKFASAMVMPSKRIQFWLPDGGEANHNLYQQSIFYFGVDDDVFITECERMGWYALTRM